MAITPLQADCACENTEQKKSPARAFLEAHAAFRHAQAQWNSALYAPGMVDQDLPEEVGDRLCEETVIARHKFMQTPSPSLASLLWKMRVFQEEELQDADKAGEYVSYLVNDAERLLRETRRGI